MSVTVAPDHTHAKIRRRIGISPVGRLEGYSGGRYAELIQRVLIDFGRDLEGADKIIAELEAGRVPWVQPWETAAAKAQIAMPKNASTTSQPYSKINVLLFWEAVIAHGTTVVYAGRFVPEDEKRRDGTAIDQKNSRSRSPPESVAVQNADQKRLGICIIRAWPLDKTKYYSYWSLNMKNSERLPDRDRARSIGELGKLTGTKVQTIRYYELIGILPEPARTAGNQRSYSRAHADRLAFIRHSRELGFSLDAIRTLLDLSDDPNRSCEQADRIARHHLQDVNTRIESLAVLKAELERMIRQCRRRKIADCRIIEVLADHANCTTEDHHTSAVASAALKRSPRRKR